MPVWLQRLMTAEYVIFCFLLGIVLVALPWTPLWFNNSLLEHLPAVRRFTQLGFVRGAISGLGVLDLWAGLSEAFNYRDRR